MNTDRLELAKENTVKIIYDIIKGKVDKLTEDQLKKTLYEIDAHAREAQTLEQQFKELCGSPPMFPIEAETRRLKRKIKRKKARNKRK